MFAGCDGLAEDGIDQRSDRGFARLDGFVDGGVIGDVENEDLAETDAEDIAGLGIEFSLPEFCYLVIEYAAVAEDTEQDCLKQSAIRR